MKMIKTIIFDYGGVICTQPRSKQFAEWAAEEYGLDFETILQLFNSPLADQYSIGAVDSRIFYQQFQKAGMCLSGEELKAKLASLSKPDPEMKELVEKLSERYDLAVLSDSYPELTAVVRINFPETFRVEIFSEEAGMKKPDPKIYELTLSLIGNQPSECLFIDDREKNLAYPRELGVRVVRFESVSSLKEILCSEYNTNSTTRASPPP